MDYVIAACSQDEDSFQSMAAFLSRLKYSREDKFSEPKKTFDNVIQKKTTEGYNILHVAALLHDYEVFINLELHYPKLLKEIDSKGHTPQQYLLSSWYFDVVVNNSREVAKYFPSLNQAFDFSVNSQLDDDKILHKFLLLCKDPYVIGYALENRIISTTSLNLVKDFMDLELRNILADAGFEDDLPSMNAFVLAQELDNDSFCLESVVEKLSSICTKFGDADLFYDSQDYNIIVTLIQNLVKKLDSLSDSSLKTEILELYEEYFSENTLIFSK